MNRYSGKPLLRLIECYVLDVVGQLDNQQRATLEAMEPKLQSLYKSGGTWRQIVAEQMNFDESLNDQIRGFWKMYSSDALARGMPVDANQFAMLFVNQNFDIE